MSYSPVRSALYLKVLLCIAAAALASRSIAAPAGTPLYTFDLTAVKKYNLDTTAGKNNAWAEVHLVSALQGLVNRFTPRLYVYAISSNSTEPGHIDKFWLARLREPGEWLSGKPLQSIPSLDALVAKFRSSFRGVVLYDLRVPATSNVASTIAGCDNLLPVPYDPTPGSVYDRFVAHGPHLPVLARLLHPNGTSMFTGSETGSAKCDAYLWAKRQYLDTGKCEPSLLAYFLDSWWLNKPRQAEMECNTLTNHDYFVSRKAFFFDLSPWADEAPQDDPHQVLGMDARTLCAILRSAYNQTHGKRMISVGGFIPWAWKYTNFSGGQHEIVASEWRYVSILSCFNAFLDADAFAINGMANASVYTHYPLKSHYAQHKPSLADWQKAGYVDSSGQVAPHTYITFYLGDYDAAAWLYQLLPTVWSDPSRGKQPLGWAFNPNLSARFPVGFAWTRRTATPNDYFIAGDSGAGYLNPGNLDGERRYSHLPSGVQTWRAHCKHYFDLWDISLTGFILDGESPPMSGEALSAYADFSKDGFVAQKLPAYAGIVSGTTCPYLTAGLDMPGAIYAWDKSMPDAAALQESMKRIQADLHNDHGSTPHFHSFRTVVWSPSQVEQLAASAAALPNVVVVDPYTLMGLLRLSAASH